MAAEAVLHFQKSDSHTFLYDTHGWAVFTLLMALGGAVALWPVLLAAIQRGRWASLAVGIAAFAVLDRMGLMGGVKPPMMTFLTGLQWDVASALNMLAWVLTVMGFATHWLNRGSALLSYLSEAALPVYILHQTLGVATVYLIDVLTWPLIVKVVLTIAVSLLGSFAIYEVAVRRSWWLRPLFGLRVASSTSRWSERSS